MSHNNLDVSRETREDDYVEVFIKFLYAFLVGGCLCLIGQILIDYTKLTPARILTAYVVMGVALTGVGIYQPLVDLAGAGATVPLTGFGYSLAKGVEQAVEDKGALGIISGGLTATAAGITVAVTMGFLASLLFNSDEK